MMADYGFADFDAGQLAGSMAGYVIDRVMSARDALQPLEAAFFFDSFESQGQVRFAHRGRGGSLANLTPDALVETSADAPRYELTRAQESDLPRAAKVTFIDGDRDYEQASAEGRRISGGAARIASARLPIVTTYGQARAYRRNDGAGAMGVARTRTLQPAAFAAGARRLGPRHARRDRPQLSAAPHRPLGRADHRGRSDVDRAAALRRLRRAGAAAGRGNAFGLRRAARRLPRPAAHTRRRGALRRHCRGLRFALARRRRLLPLADDQWLYVQGAGRDAGQDRRNRYGVLFRPRLALGSAATCCASRWRMARWYRRTPSWCSAGPTSRRSRTPMASGR